MASQPFNPTPQVFTHASGKQATYNFTWTYMLPTSPGASSSNLNKQSTVNPVSPLSTEKKLSGALVLRRKSAKPNHKTSSALYHVPKAQQLQEKLSCRWKRTSAMVKLCNKAQGGQVRMRLDTITLCYERRTARLEQLGGILRKHLTIQKGILVRKRAEVLPSQTV